MITLVVDLVLATLCITGSPQSDQCFNVLVGADTPRGEFTLIQRLTKDPGYSGDVLQFKETETLAYSIHRPWLLRPKEKRLERLASQNPKDRRTITKGCINVPFAAYDVLVSCCSNARLEVK